MTKYGKEKRNVRNKNTGTKTVTRNRKVRSKNSKRRKNGTKINTNQLVDLVVINKIKFIIKEINKTIYATNK